MDWLESSINTLDRCYSPIISLILISKNLLIVLFLLYWRILGASPFSSNWYLIAVLASCGFNLSDMKWVCNSLSDVMDQNFHTIRPKRHDTVNWIQEHKIYGKLKWNYVRQIVWQSLEFLILCLPWEQVFSYVYIIIYRSACRGWALEFELCRKTLILRRSICRKEHLELFLEYLCNVHWQYSGENILTEFITPMKFMPKSVLPSTPGNKNLIYFTAESNSIREFFNTPPYSLLLHSLITFGQIHFGIICGLNGLKRMGYLGFWNKKLDDLFRVRF